jgi:hypothetical protein
MMRALLEAFGPHEYGNEVEEKASSGERGQPQIGCHITCPSRIVAQADISEAGGDQSQGDPQPE